MPIQFDNFDQNKVDRLKNHLQTLADKNKAKFYEIFVDNLKAVPKTDEISDFDAYEDYINVDTEQLKIIIYNSSLSPRNDQYVFILKAKSREDAQNIGLNGMPLPKYSKNDISEWRTSNAKRTQEEIQIASLRGEIRRLEQESREKDLCIRELENKIYIAQKNGNKIGGIHVGDMLSVALDGLITKGTLNKIPVLSGLAGLMKGGNNNESTKPQTDTEATFEKLDNNTHNSSPELNEEDKHSLELMKNIQSQFNENEFGSVLEILDALNEDKALIPQVLEFINEEEEESSTEEK